MLLPIDNDPRDYAWGRRGAISELLGRQATARVEAELWLGTHHGSPARVLEPSLVGGATDLAVALAADPALTGGIGRLPFLLKVLAAGSPLSLQAHPDAAEAAEGFERENAAGIPLDARERNYKDPYPKPELIVAVSATFEALSGFRPVVQTRLDLARIADSAGRVDAVEPLLDRLVSDETVGDAFSWLLGGTREVKAVVDAVTLGVERDPAAQPYLARIAALHPGDPGIVGALLLHHIVLARGEALYLPAGNVHAYLDGIGIELMVASDNVLRGGLTEKHVDAAELARILDPAARPIPLLAPRALADGGVEYLPDGAGFSLAFTDGHALLRLDGPAVALCTAGEFAIEGARSSATLARGGAIFVSPDEGAIRVSGSGALYVAR